MAARDAVQVAPVCVRQPFATTIQTQVLKQRAASLNRHHPACDRPPRVDDLKDKFEKYGPVRDVYIPRDYHSG